MATGICTYALLVIASLLPVGLGSIQSSSRQVTQTEIFNGIWSDLMSTPYGNITNYPGLTNTATYYNSEGDETGQSSSSFTVVCKPAVIALPTSSGGTYSTNEWAAIKVQIGYHVDPTAVKANDPRVSTRTFILVRRDGSTNYIPNGS